MRGFLILVAILIAGFWAISEYEHSPDRVAQRAKEAAQHEANKVPRVVSKSADGCTVYTFNPGDRWRYFTRCGDQTTTDNNYTVSRTSGKTTTTETVEDSITSQGKQPP